MAQKRSIGGVRMRIIKDGNVNQLLKLKIFTCEKCGCEFEANNKEYKIDSHRNETYYYAKCPMTGCNNTVYLG